MPIPQTVRTTSQGSTMSGRTAAHRSRVCAKLNGCAGGLIDRWSEISGGLVVFWTSQTIFFFTRTVCGDHLRRGLIDYSLPDGRPDWLLVQLFNALSTFDVTGRKVWLALRYHTEGLVGSCRPKPAGLIDPRRNTLRLHKGKMKHLTFFNP